MEANLRNIIFFKKASEFRFTWLCGTGKLKETEEKLAAERKNEALICAKYQSEKDSIIAEEKKLNQLIKSVQDVSSLSCLLESNNNKLYKLKII